MSLLYHPVSAATDPLGAPNACVKLLFWNPRSDADATMG